MRVDEPGADLPLDEGLCRVGGGGVDLHAAVHGPRMHDPLARAQPRGRHAPAGAVLT